MGGRGFSGCCARKDFEFTVTGRRRTSPRATGGSTSPTAALLAATGVHPTMWVRLWFTDARQAPPAGVHPGRPRSGGRHLQPGGSRCTRGCASRLGPGRRSPGTPSRATVQGTGFEDPEPAPLPRLRHRRPGVASCAQLPSGERSVSTPGDRLVRGATATASPFRADPARHEVRQVLRLNSGAHLVDRGAGGSARPAQGQRPTRTSGSPATRTTTRALSSYVRKELGRAQGAGACAGVLAGVARAPTRPPVQGRLQRGRGRGTGTGPVLGGSATVCGKERRHHRGAA